MGSWGRGGKCGCADRSGAMGAVDVDLVTSRLGEAGAVSDPWSTANISIDRTCADADASGLRRAHHWNGRSLEEGGAGRNSSSNATMPRPCILRRDVLYTEAPWVRSAPLWCKPCTELSSHPLAQRLQVKYTCVRIPTASPPEHHAIVTVTRVRAATIGTDTPARRS